MRQLQISRAVHDALYPRLNCRLQGPVVNNDYAETTLKSLVLQGSWRHGFIELGFDAWRVAKHLSDLGIVTVRFRLRPEAKVCLRLCKRHRVHPRIANTFPRSIPNFGLFS